MVNDIKDIAHAVEAASVMRLFASPPWMLTLGEPTHGVDAPLRLRNALFRQLVEREGYRTIAVESDCVAGLLVDDYVTTGAGALDDVLERGFSHGLGASAASRELVDWMRAFNNGRPASDQVQFAGFDGPLEMARAASPRETLTALHRTLTDHVDPGLIPCTARDARPSARPRRPSGPRPEQMPETRPRRSGSPPRPGSCGSSPTIWRRCSTPGDRTVKAASWEWHASTGTRSARGRRRPMRRERPHCRIRAAGPPWPSRTSCGRAPC
ncbi:hypothetical protein SBADM41S_03570 [Streptomyces badius]